MSLMIGDRVIIDEKMANMALITEAKFEQVRAAQNDQWERFYKHDWAPSQRRSRWSVGIAIFAAGFAMGSFVLSVIRIYYLGIERGFH